jgi:uncharacterized protein (TIGR02246 family)
MVTKIARKNFINWNKALKTKDPKKVAVLYSKDAALLPTLSPEFKTKPCGIKEYFEHFLKKNPVGKIVVSKVQVLGSKSYLHSGLYNFEVGSKGAREIIKARFSFIWKQNRKGEWKIVHHHSSLKPESA